MRKRTREQETEKVEFMQWSIMLYIIIINQLCTWKKSSSSKSSPSSSSNFSFCQFVCQFLRNSSFLTLPGSFAVIPQTQNEFQIISRWFFKQLMPSAMQLTMSCLDGNQQFKLTIRNTNKKMTDVMKEKLNLLVEEYKRINSKPKE